MSQTYKPKNLRRKRRHGFKKRSQTKDGRVVMQRRRRKGRKKITTV